jgi:hypothetical protein
LKRSVKEEDIEGVVLLSRVKGKTYQVILKQSYARVLLDMARIYSKDSILQLVELEDIELGVIPGE